MLTMHRKIRISLYVFITLSFLAATQAQAEVTHWRHDPATPGNWFANANWSAGVPGFEDRACIYNGGTAVIARGFANAGQLNIGTVLQPAYAEEISAVQPWPGTGAVRQIGGTTTVKGGIYLSGSLRRPGTYTLARGRLSARNIVVGRGPGSGRFIQVGGINRVKQELKVGDLGRWPLSKKYNLKSSLGTYRLHRGWLVTGRTSVGVAGRGRFVQTGGVHRVKGLLAVGGPQRPWPWLEAVPVPIDEIGEPVILDDPSWAGEIVDGPLWPKVAIPYPLPSKGRYVLRGGALLAGNIRVGGWGLRGSTADFIQTGGYCNVQRVLRVGCCPFRRIRVLDGDLEEAEAYPLDIVDLPEGPLDDVTAIPYPRMSATYRMRDGRLSAGSLCLYGLGGRLNRARFIQTGGAVRLRRGLSVYGRNAGYTMLGGRLSTPVLRIGSRYARSGGRLVINKQAEIKVSQRLSFGAGSTFIASPGSTIHITGPRPETDCQCPGSTFENFSTDPAALAGLENLTLIFEGGDEFTATFEVAGEDKGYDPSGLYENFALNTLQIGGDDVAMVQLVDLFDNQPDSELPEALYVRNLFISAGSSLDTNGLALYCLNDGAIMQLFDVDLDGFIGQDDLAALGYAGGGSPPPPPGVIPEPATLALLIIGGMFCLVRKRRN